MFHTKIRELRTKHQALIADTQALNVQVRTLYDVMEGFERDIAALSLEEVRHTKVIALYKQITDERASAGKEMLVNVLNWALSNIPLEQRYEASIEERVSGTRKEFSIILRDLDTGHIRNLRNQSGTALVQIISFLMNVILIILSNSTRVMLLDECFSGLQDQDTISMFGEILVALARNENFQFIMVEHKSELHTVEGIQGIVCTLEDYEHGLQLSYV